MAAAFSLIAGLAHATVVREHFGEWWGYGVFFVVSAVAQLLFAAAIMAAPSRGLTFAGIAGNAAVLGLYAVSRTTGIPFLGPNAGEVEAVSTVDVVCGVAEAGLIAALALVARRGPLESAPPRRRTLVVATGWLIVSLAGAPGGAVTAAADHEIAHVEPTMAMTEAPAPVLHHEKPGPPPDTIQAQPSPEPQADPCRPVAAAPPGIPSAGTPGEARAIVMVHDRDVWIHDLATGRSSRLTRKTEDCSAGQAVFKNERTVTFDLGDGIYDVDLVTGHLTLIVQQRGGVGPFAWSPDRKALAYLTWAPKLYLFKDGTTKVIRGFSEGGGRCGGEGDEVRVAFSPDGRNILATITYLDFTNQTMFVLDARNGRDVAAPRMGTMGRWGDASTIYYRDFSWTGRVGWHALDVARGGTTEKLAIAEARSLRLSVSPDGRRLAYDDAGRTPSLYVYEIATRTENRLAEGRVYATWLANDRVAATSTRPCSGEQCMGDWEENGSVDSFDLSGHAEHLDGIASTMDADVLFASPAPQASPTPSPTPSTTPSSPPAASPVPSESPLVIPTPPVSPTEEPSPAPTSSPEPTPTSTPTSERFPGTDVP